jgi:hypothetical protein
VPIVLRSGSLNLLEHLGPVKACNGIALPFYQHCGQRYAQTVSVSFRELQPCCKESLRLPRQPVPAPALKLAMKEFGERLIIRFFVLQDFHILNHFDCYLWVTPTNWKKIQRESASVNMKQRERERVTTSVLCCETFPKSGRFVYKLEGQAV